MKKSALIGLCLTASLALSPMVSGQGRGPGGGGPGGGGPGGGQSGMRGSQKPPQEALDACKDKDSGDSCSFESSNGEISGTCFAPQKDLPLACRPDRPSR